MVNLLLILLIFFSNVASESATDILIEEPKDTEPTTQPDTIELTQPITDESENVVEITKTTEKPKKKKTIKKIKKTAEDDYLTQLMEAEIPKTKLEKYEKIDLDSDNKPKIKAVEEIPQPAPVQRKEVKPMQVETPVVEELQPIKLKPKKPKLLEKEVESVIVPTRRLKSRLVLVSYPPEPQRPSVTELNAVRQHGDLSRTIEEAEEELKKKPKKFKHIKKRKDSLEKPDLEVYERYVSSSDEEAESTKYIRPEKPLQLEEPAAKTLKLGKGKKIPHDDETPEVVKLKKPPVKSVEEAEVNLPVKRKQEEPIKSHSDVKEDADFDLNKCKPTEFEPFESVKEDHVSDETPINDDIQPIDDKSKKPRRKKSKPEQENIPSKIILGVPKPKEDSPEKDVSFKFAQKPVPEQDVEKIVLKPFVKPTEDELPEDTEHDVQTITVPKETSPEPIETKLKLKKKISKKPVDEPDAITVQLKQPADKVPTELQVEDDVTVVLKPIIQHSPVEEEITEQVRLKTSIIKSEESAAAILTLKQDEEVKLPETPEEKHEPKPTAKVHEIDQEILLQLDKSTEEANAVTLKLKKDIVPTSDIVEELEEQDYVVNIKPKPQTDFDEVSEQLKIKQPILTTNESADAELKIIQPDNIPEVELKKKKPKKVKVHTEEEVVIKKSKKKKVDEMPQSDFTVKKKPVVEEVEEEFTIEQPQKTVEPDEETKSIVVKRSKPAKVVLEESADATIQLRDNIEPSEELPEEEFQVKLGRPKAKQLHLEEIEVDATFVAPNINEPREDITEEFTIKKKVIKKPTPVIEEQEGEFTVKKLKKKKKVIDIPGYTDIENVTFRPRSTKTMEDVDQEFQIHLDSYAEEEVSMSGKVKLRKTRPLTYSEEAGEVNIKITEEYDDQEGPIIEEIDDDFSEPEDTMYDVDEPEEFSDIEDLPKEVEVTLKSKKKKPQYRVEENEEEDVSIHTVRRKQKQPATYDEDSLTLKKPPKRKPSTYLEGYYEDIQHVVVVLATKMSCFLIFFKKMPK